MKLLRYTKEANITGLLSASNTLLSSASDYTKHLWSHLHYLQRGDIDLFERNDKVPLALTHLMCKGSNFNARPDSIETISLSQLRTVFLRGMLSLLDIASDKVYVYDLAMARVNLFLKMVRGESVNNKYRAEDGVLIYGLEKQGSDFLLFNSIFPKLIEDIKSDDLFEDLDKENYCVSGGAKSGLTNINIYINDLLAECGVWSSFDFFQEGEITNCFCGRTNKLLSLIKDSGFDPHVIENILLNGTNS